VIGLYELACESLKGPISLAIDVLFRFLFVFTTIFSLFRKIIMLNSLRLLNILLETRELASTVLVIGLYELLGNPTT
jgi:hypothetical protein